MCTTGIRKSVDCTMGALPKRNGYGMVTQTANARGREGDMFIFRLLLGDELSIDVKSQHNLPHGFEVKSLVRLRCTVAIFVAYIEWWAHRHVRHNYSLRMFRKTGSELLAVRMYNKMHISRVLMSLALERTRL
jgi:hypothetical protein